jgi:photosystem II stability/assembly factor-like uncharacterized protein
MKHMVYVCLLLSLVLAGCTSSATSTPSVTPTTTPPATPTPRPTLVPSWTPTQPGTPTRTPRPHASSTPLLSPTNAGLSGTVYPTPTPLDRSTEVLLDRPTYTNDTQPPALVSMRYDPAIWTLTTVYPTALMGYGLTHRSIFNCSLEPSVERGVEGYDVEHLITSLGATTFEVAKVSQGGSLVFSNYCTGEATDYTCYQMNPGADPEACTRDAEAVLSSFELIPNPFYAAVPVSRDHWICQDEAGTVGLCQIAYSVSMNTLAFTRGGQAWAAGENGTLLHFDGQEWTKITSPATNALYDLGFTSPTNGWAVGEGAQVLHWDGTEWSEVLPYHAPGEGPGGSTQVLYAVNAHTANDVWMVGAMTGIDGRTTPYALHWNGTDLIEESAFPDCNCGLNAVLVLGANDVLAVGGSDLGAIAFRWDGSTWESTLVHGADHLYALSWAQDGIVWAAGMEISPDQMDTRGTLFRWDGKDWQRIALPPLTGGLYALAALPYDQVVVGGDFTALRLGLVWNPITTDIAGYGWIMDIEVDEQGTVWALTHSGNLFRLEMGR